jgi:ATP-dependent helicase HepA
MLHLIDPALYPLDDVEGFKRRVDDKRDFALRFQAFTATADDFVLEEHAEAFKAQLPDDATLTAMLDEVLARIDAETASGPEFEALVRAVRVHLGETYRLHRRVLRTRRDSALAEGFPVRGRSGPLALEAPRTGAEDLDAWVHGWLTTYSARLNGGRLATADRTILLGLLERIATHPDILDGFILSWTGGSPLSIAELTAAEAEAIVVSPPRGREVDELDELRALLKTNEAERPWSQAAADAIATFDEQVVVFCGFTSAARAVAGELAGRVGTDVALFARGENLDEQFDRFERGSARILVGDAGLEEGRNIQFAQRLVHVHVPWNPNRLEQRIGRADRFGRGGPVPQHVVGGGLLDDWVRLLDRGFGVFSESIASLQHVLDGAIAEAVDLVVAEGHESWSTLAGGLRDRLRSEARDIQQIENLESIEAESAFARSIHRDLCEVESDEDNLLRAVEAWLCGNPSRGAGGLGFESQVERGRPRSRRYRTTSDGPVPEQALLASFRPYLGRASSTHRGEVLERPQSLFLRPGDRFFETIRRFTDEDDLGQTFAMWRRASSDDPEFVASLHVRLEASADAAMPHLGNHGIEIQRSTVQRLLDGLLRPSSHQVHLMLDGSAPPERLESKLDQRFNDRADEAIAPRHLARLERHLGMDWRASWRSIGSAGVELAADLAGLSGQRAAAIGALARSYDESRRKLELRQRAERDARRCDRLDRELHESSVLASALRSAIEGAEPCVEAVGLVVLCLWRPEELWPDDVE